MKNKSVTIPAGMVFKRFYCHKCGERLVKHPNKRIVKPGDSDYREHSRIGDMNVIGDIEVTEYDFKCHDCGNIIHYNEQRVIEKIQNKLQKNVLSDEEISENREIIEKKIKIKQKIFRIALGVITVAIVAVVFYAKAKSGDWSFEFYF